MWGAGWEGVRCGAPSTFGGQTCGVGARTSCLRPHAVTPTTMNDSSRWGVGNGGAGTGGGLGGRDIGHTAGRACRGSQEGLEREKIGEEVGIESASHGGGGGRETRTEGWPTGQTVRGGRTPSAQARSQPARRGPVATHTGARRPALPGRHEAGRRWNAPAVRPAAPRRRQARARPPPALTTSRSSRALCP